MTYFNLDFESFDEEASKDLSPEINAEVAEQEQFDKEHMGLFTGSSMKTLMGQSKDCKGWDEKGLWSFGDTAKRLITEKAIERYCGVKATGSFTSRYTDHGKEFESEGLAYISEIKGLEIDESCLIRLEGTNIAATPDGIAKADQDMVVELKCPPTMINHITYLGDDPNEPSHDYFWQTQTELLVTGLERGIFCTYQPSLPTAIKGGVKYFYKSKLHQEAIIKRAEIADKIIQGLIDSEFKESFREVLMRIKPDKFKSTISKGKTKTKHEPGNTFEAMLM